MSALDRCLLVASCAFMTFVAVSLLVAPQNFYVTIPGLAASGPMNAHLMRDVGIAYAVLAFGLGFALECPSRARFATVAAALYLCSHAALHVVMALTGGNRPVVWAEAPGVYLPALLATSIAYRFSRINQRYNNLEAET